MEDEDTRYGFGGKKSDDHLDPSLHFAGVEHGWKGANGDTAKRISNHHLNPNSIQSYAHLTGVDDGWKGASGNTANNHHLNPTNTKSYSHLTSVGNADQQATGNTINKNNNDFYWSDPDLSDRASPRRYRYPTLGSDHTAFVRARADPLACNLDNDMVLLWNERTMEHHRTGFGGVLTSKSGDPQSEDQESIEDAYQRLFESVLRHREDLEVTLRDAGLDRAQDLFADSDSACGALDDVRDDLDGVEDEDDSDEDNEDDDDDDVFDDSGVRGSWELLSDDADVTERTCHAVGQGVGLSDEQNLTVTCSEVRDNREKGPKNKTTQKLERCTQIQKPLQQDKVKFVPNNRSENTLINLNGNNTNDINHSRNEEWDSRDVTLRMERGLSGHNSSRFDSAFYDSSCSSEDDPAIGDAVQGSVDTSTSQRDNLGTQALSLNDNRNMKLSTDESQQVREESNAANLPVAQTREIYGKSSLYVDEKIKTNSDFAGDESQEQDHTGLSGPELRTEMKDLYHHNDADIKTHRLNQSSPSPVDSPPASMDQFCPQNTQGSTENFLHSSPILPRSNKLNTGESQSGQHSGQGDCQIPLSLAVPQSHDHHKDWDGMSILPLVACPHHHELPVIDAPGSFTPTLVHCHTPDCGKSATLDVARHMYKNCHNCRGTYYCSRKCRRQDWARHKREVCHGSRVSQACKRVIRFCGLDPNLKAALSRLARRGFLSSGRGCVMLGFPDLCATEEFLSCGLNSPQKWYHDSGVSTTSCLELLPVYVTLSELRDSKMYGGGEVLQRLMTLCETYNPNHKFLLNVGIGVRWNREHLTKPQDLSSQLKTSSTGRSFSRLDSEILNVNGPTPSRIHSQSSKEQSPSFHSTTMDSGYNSLSRSTSSRTQRLSSNNNSTRSRSASINDDDVGYGSLGDIRDGLSQSQSPLSPSHSSFLDNSVFHSSQPPASPLFSSPLSPPANSENVVYYLDPEPRLKCPIIQKCACLRLFNPEFDPILGPTPHNLKSIPSQESKTSSPKNPLKNFPKRSRLLWPRRCAPTLILTDVPGSWYEAQEELRLKSFDSKSYPTQDMDTNRQAVQRKARELCFANIQKRLRERGVSLRRQFPEIYAELVHYVAGDLEHFPSRIIFPVERQGQGKTFTCVLMPEAEPDLRWTQTAQLLDNLDISRDRVWCPFVSGQEVKLSESASSHNHRSIGQENCRTSLLVSGSPPQEGRQSHDSSDKILRDSSRSLQTPMAQDKSMQHMNTVQNSNKTEYDHQDPNFMPKSGTEQSSESAIELETKEPVCLRCLAKPNLMDRSTQTAVPINSKRIKQTVPDLIKICPTSSLTRRKFNTNFPIFSFDSEVLDMLTSWVQSTRNNSKDLNAIRPLLLGHLACSSLLSRYQNFPSNPSDTNCQQIPPEPSQDTNREIPSQCPFINSVALSKQYKTSGKDSESKQEHNENRKELRINRAILDNKACTSSTNHSSSKPKERDSNLDEEKTVKKETSAFSHRQSLPSQDKVDFILSDWRNSRGKSKNHSIHENTTGTSDENTTGTSDENTTRASHDNLLWSCKVCTDPHPHNHPYRDPPCVADRPRNHSNLSNPTPPISKNCAVKQQQ